VGGPILTAVIPLNGLDDSNLGLHKVVSMALRAGINVSIIINHEDATIRALISNFFENIKSSELKILYSATQSPGTARNIGIKDCNTHYITFWDSDDIPNIPEVLNLVDILKNKPEKKFGIGSYQVQDSKSGRVISKNKIIGKKEPKNLLIKNPGIWRWIFMTTEVKRINFQEFKMGEDQDFIADLNPDLKDAVFTNEIIYSYTIGNQSQLTNSKKAINEISKSIHYLCLLNKSSKRNNWSRKLLTRQVLTGIKRATFKVKIEILIILIKGTVQNE
jgi:hypothetical protein